MPVHVEVPIRLKVDPQALSQNQDAILASLSAGLLRALQNSRRRVLGRRGGYVGIQVHPPEFTWRGSGLATVTPGLRTEIQQAVEELLGELTERSGLFELAESAEEAPWPLEEEAVESFDRTRRARFNKYRLPFYDEPTSAGDVDLDEAQASEPRPGLPVDRWAVFSGELLQRPELLDYLLTEAYERYGQPASPLHGLIWYTGSELLLWVKNFSTGEWFAFNSDPDSLVYYRFRGFNETPAWESVAGPPDPSVVTARFLGPYSPDQRVEVVRELMGQGIRRDIQLSNQAELLREEEIQEQVEVEVERRAQEFPNQQFRVLQIVFATRTLLLKGQPEYTFEGDATLLPITLTDLVMPGDEGDGAGGTQRGTGRRRGSGGRGGTGAGGDAGQRGGVLLTGEAGAEGGRIFPDSSYNYGGETDCSPLLDEPPLDALAEDQRAALVHQMEEIAYRLEIPMCGHAARFCVNAAQALGARAAGVSEAAIYDTNFSQPITPAPPGQTGNFGAVNFAPFPSPGIQLLRHLAGTVPYISRLSETIMAIYATPENRIKIGGTWGDDPPGWNLHFLYELSPAMKESIGFLFGFTCQILLLQLLRGSHQAITERLSNIENYARNFEQVILPQLQTVEELTELRSRLQTYTRLQQVEEVTSTLTSSSAFEVAHLTSLAPTAAWVEATHGLTGALVESNRARSPERGERGQVVVEGNTVRIFDGNNRLWTMAGLERAIAMRRGTLEEVDPLIKQFTDLPEVMERFRRGSVRVEIQRLLREMLSENEEKTQEAENSWMYAFRASRINKAYTADTLPGTSYTLGGIHRLAHEQVGEFCRGDGYYAAGLNSLFGAELGLEALTQFFEFTGLILLAIVCPPLALGAGIVLAAHEYEKAVEREELYHSLIDPELVLTWAEVEAELFAARLGLALAIIPEAGSILGKGVSAGVRLGARGSVRALAAGSRRALGAGVRGAERAVVNHLTREAARSLERGLVRALAEELLTDQVVSQLMTQVLTPILDHVEREAEATGPMGGYAGAERFLQRLEQEALGSNSTGGVDTGQQPSGEDESLADDGPELEAEE